MTTKTLSRTDPFFSSKYCINRAELHIDNFKRICKDFFMTEPYPYIIQKEVDFKTREKVFTLTLTKPLPEELPGLVFDACNNLRAALDQAIFSVTQRERSAFPVVRDIQYFEPRLNGDCNGAPVEILDIVRAVKPYKGGNNLIFALNHLCNASKHEIVFPVATISGGAKINNAPVQGGEARAVHTRNRIQDKIEVYRDRFNANLTPNDKLAISAGVAICGVEFIDTKPAGAVFNEFVDVVKGIVMTIESEAIRIGCVS